MSAKNISIDEAKKDKLFYFVANAVIYRSSDKRCLILKRSAREKVHPGKWAVPGGKLEWGDMDLSKPTRLNGEVIDFEDAVERLLEREVFEEAGVRVDGPLHFINDVAFVRPDGIPVVLIKFAVKYKSGEVKLEPGAFDDFAWVNSKEVKDYDCIDGVSEEVDITISLYSKQ
ncbi:MAG: NUDIX domain-containing protein [Candidatus Saccharibacteria bacterium]